MNGILAKVKQATLLSLVLLVLCGLLYPLAVTGISQLIFPSQANGSLIEKDGVMVGSVLVGQDFTDPRLMKCRPSAVSYNTYTAEQSASGEYGGVSSGSNNYGATNADLLARVEADLALLMANNPSIAMTDIPTDLATASGSGLDPHISPASAEVQVPALAVATGLTEDVLRGIVAENTKGKTLGIFGEETVNVLKVNLAIAEQINL